MPKTLEKTKSALKLKTEAKSGVLSLRMGVKKFVLPFEVRMLNSKDYVFIHIPPSAEIMKVTTKGLAVVGSDTEAEAAVQSFKQSRKRARRTRGSQVTIPSDLEVMLKKLPSGHKIGYGPDGKPKLIKSRQRSPKKK